MHKKEFFLFGQHSLNTNMTNKTRHPQVGDLIIKKKSKSSENDIIGVVYKLGYRNAYEYNGFHRGSLICFIYWSKNKPLLYDNNYGYLSSNIHNLRNTFDIIRNGISIP